MQGLVGASVLLSCLGGLATGRAVFSLERRLLSGVLHPFGPFHYFRAVAHLDDCFCRDQVKVVHLVAVRTQHDQILRIVVLAIAVNVGNLQHSGDAESAVGAQSAVGPECDLPVIDPFHHLISGEAVH